MIALMISRAGYYGGDPERVLSARVDLVCDVLGYEKFRGDYELADYELNKD